MVHLNRVGHVLGAGSAAEDRAVATAIRDTSLSLPNIIRGFLTGLLEAKGMNALEGLTLRLQSVSVRVATHIVRRSCPLLDQPKWLGLVGLQPSFRLFVLRFPGLELVACLDGSKFAPHHHDCQLDELS